MAVELEDLRMFLVVGRTGSFSAAAAELFRSQPSVSERMSQLEHQVGAGLFERHHRGVRLTPAARSLQPYAERCLALVDEAMAAVRGTRARRTLRIGIYGSFAQHLVPTMLDALGSLDVDVSCVEAHSEQIVELVAAARLEVVHEPVEDVAHRRLTGFETVIAR